MRDQEFIPTKTICSQYNIEITFVEDLFQMGLIHIEIIEQNKCIHQDQIADLEKMIRIHQELNVNLEGIDIVFNLLEKERELRLELNALKNRLKIYEK